MSSSPSLNFKLFVSLNFSTNIFISFLNWINVSGLSLYICFCTLSRFQIVMTMRCLKKKMMIISKEEDDETWCVQGSWYFEGIINRFDFRINLSYVATLFPKDWYYCCQLSIAIGFDAGVLSCLEHMHESRIVVWRWRVHDCLMLSEV